MHYELSLLVFIIHDAMLKYILGTEPGLTRRKRLTNKYITSSQKKKLCQLEISPWGCRNHTRDVPLAAQLVLLQVKLDVGPRVCGMTHFYRNRSVFAAGATPTRHRKMLDDSRTGSCALRVEEVHVVVVCSVASS